jgi:hypothetical protein
VGTLLIASYISIRHRAETAIGGQARPKTARQQPVTSR